jgi:hypothetical protein
VQRGEQLARFLAGQGACAFDWASSNCGHYTAAWVQATTGRNPMAGLPTTPNVRAALRLVHKLGGSLEAACTRLLGAAPIPAALAQLGDLVLIPTGPGGCGGALGICAGRTAVFRTTEGLVSLPMSQAVSAWRVSP